MKKPGLIILTLILVVVALSFVKIFISNNVSTSGLVLVKIQEELEKYKFENLVIKEKLYAMTALTSVSEKAQVLGYVDSKKDLVLTRQVPVAIKQ